MNLLGRNTPAEHRKVDRSTWMIGYFIGAILFFITFWGVVIYTAHHFIVKYW